MTHREVVAIDGKILRRSFRHAEDKALVHRVVLGQLKAEEMFSATTASSRLLELLHIKGATVTIDAMGCQNDIADKENQPTLHSDIVALFNRAAKDVNFLGGLDFCEITSNGRGRIEVNRTLNGKTTREQRE